MSTDILSYAFTVAPGSNTNANIKIQDICISDDPFQQFKTNQDQFDYGMRCWSGKYKDINRKDQFITSYISDAGCNSVTSSCSTSFGEDLEYIPYFDVLTEQNDYNDPACFVGKFADPDHPTYNNKLCYMFKKCESPPQSLYKKSWGFSGVNVTTSMCQNIVPNITRKISIEWDDEFEINYGTLSVDSSSVYTLNNNYLIFSLRPIRFPSQGFGNRSVYISFMNLNDSSYGQEQSNLTWTFELNNEFGVKFYRGDRNVTERLIATQFIENILDGTDDTVRGYCYADHYINITYAEDGENFDELIVNDYFENMVTFTLNDVSFVSKLRFSVENDNDEGGGVICSINVGGEWYSTSSNSAFWSIIDSSTGNTVIKERDSSVWSSLEMSNIEQDAKWIWNYECSALNISACANQSVLFEFSFYNVNNPDGAPSFYFEWDPNQNDYIRFGFYNYSNNGIGYNDNYNLILEASYVANFRSYDIYSDGYFGYHKKIFIEDVMFSIANDSYNVDWFVYINIINATDPKPCFGYDVLSDKETRITTRDLETFSLWTDDGRSNWKLNGNTLPGWHTVKYMNLTDNSTYNRLNFPYYVHYPFVSNQKSWQRSFSIDNNIDYDYIQIEFDVFTFCGWDHETDSISVSLAFEEYLHFTKFWSSTHTQYDCEGYNSQTWDNLIDIVRMNNGTHSDISCYAQGMTSPQYDCSLNINTAEINRKEDIDVIVSCRAFGTSDLTVQYSKTGSSFDSGKTNETQPNHVRTIVSDVSRYSKLRIGVNNNNVNVISGLKCDIMVGNDTYFTNTSEQYWSVASAVSNNKGVIVRNETDRFIDSEAVFIWNNGSNDSYVEFEFDFYNVFIKEYNLNYINTQQINMSNDTNITLIFFESTPLTTCNLIIQSDGDTQADITIKDGAYVSSDTDSILGALTNTAFINKYIYIELEPFSYECRVDAYSACGYSGDVTRIATLDANINIIGNASSWKLYAARGKECIATFYNSVTNETYTINAEDGGMIAEECNTFSTFDSVNITSFDAHYGCYTHVRFEAPNTNSQPFVLRIESEIDDISTRFGSYAKSWGFGNLTIRPLYCQGFSNIVPLKSPITLSTGDVVTYTNHELSSLNYNYLFILVDFDDKDYHVELYLTLGDSKYNDKYWSISISETDCKLENLKLGTTEYCEDNINYIDLVNNITNSTVKPLIWVSWDPFEIEDHKKNLSMGLGSDLNKNLIASLNIYGDQLRDLHSYIDYVTFSGPVNDDMDMTLLPIQFAMPKICLSTLDEANKYDIGNTWDEDCNDLGWELRKSAYIMHYENYDYMFYDNESAIDQCQITNLNTNPITQIATDCFHGPFKGTEADDYGDYISRYFYVFSNIDYDIISVNLNYYSLCTWNPESNENDSAFVFINDKAIWRSAPQYEFVNQYCQGYSLYSDWTLYLEYSHVLNPELIQCLDLLDQICAYPVSVNFRHRFEKDELYFSIGIGAKLNQLKMNEAFGFSNVSISYSKCPVIEPLPIGKVRTQPYDKLNETFERGDMLVISSNSIYYLVADKDDTESEGCMFYLFGGYTMWSQNSTNCTISGLPIMQNYPYIDYNYYSIGISDDGILFLLDSNGKRKWSRRNPCAIDTAYFQYSINKTNSIGCFGGSCYSTSLYSIDCKWALITSKSGPVQVWKNVTANTRNRNGISGDPVWSIGSNVESLSFDMNGSLILNDNNEGNTVLSPKGGDYMIFDEGKLALIDYETNSILKQFDFEFAQCTLNESVGFIKYFYFMKPGDILWNGEALISKDCQYKLILSDGNLMILDGNNERIWSPNYNETTNGNGERFEFLSDGNMVLYSYSSESEIIWETQTSTLLYQRTIFYADRAILYNDGQLYIIDNKTLTPRFTLFDNRSQSNDIQTEYNYNLDCFSNKYDYIDKRYGFYASYISYYNCLDNEYLFNETTACIEFKYCPVVERYQNILLEASETCKEYAIDYWQQLTNNYVLFQISVENTDVSDEPELSIILTTSKNMRFGYEFEADYIKYRTLLVTISPKLQTITLQTKYTNRTYYNSELFGNDSSIEWLWVDWDINFDYINIGNSQYITTPIHTLKYSDLFRDIKLNRNENLFDYFNFGWEAKNIHNQHTCYGTIIVQFPPLNVDIPKGCHDSFNYTEFPESDMPTPAPTEEIIVSTEIEDGSNGANEENAAISVGGIVGIVIGCLVAIAATVFLVLYFQRRKKNVGLAGILREISVEARKKKSVIANVDTIDVDYVRMEDDDQYL